MRPVRSFFLLLIFLAVLTGLHYVIPVKTLFPALSEFIPDKLINFLLPDDKNPVKPPAQPVFDTIKEVLPDTVPPFIVDSHENISIDTDPLERFMDSMRMSKGQVRVMYYGDSQIEGDRISSFLRHELRKKHGGTGPGLLQPLMPVMYTKSVWMRSSSNWKKYNYLSFKSGEISHRDLGPFMAICRYLPEGKTVTALEKAYVRIRPSNVADSASSEFFTGTHPAMLKSLLRQRIIFYFQILCRKGSVSKRQDAGLSIRRKYQLNLKVSSVLIFMGSALRATEA
jgi:hypothetical protein